MPSHQATPDRAADQGRQCDLDTPDRPTPGNGARDSETRGGTIVDRAQLDWQEQDDAAESELQEEHAWSRRALFGAAGEFALAASGLFLPGRFVEVAKAGQHPLERIQRRARSRHQQHHRHKRRHRDDGKPRGGSFGLRGIEFRAEGGGFRPTQIKFYEYQKDGGGYSYPILVETKTIEPNSRATFHTESNAALLWIQDRFVVLAENPLLGFPSLTLGYGGAINLADGWHDGTTTFDGSMQEGQSAPAMQVDGYSIHATRLDDTADYKVFYVYIFAPSA